MKTEIEGMAGAVPGIEHLLGKASPKWMNSIGPGLATGRTQRASGSVRFVQRLWLFLRGKI